MLRLNWRLVMAPPELMDYVAAHEVCHLRRLDHSPAFWALVESLVPDWRARRQRLNRTGALYRL
ncbi:MAG: M48 family metallopeptidase [Pseudomonadota bacterium]